jgi:hypothetical protein
MPSDPGDEVDKFLAERRAFEARQQELIKDINGAAAKPSRSHHKKEDAKQ